MGLSRLRIGMTFDGVATLLHEPLGSACSATNTDGLYTLKPLRIDFFGIFNKMSIGIDPQTLIEKHLTIAALATTYKENQVVA